MLQWIEIALLRVDPRYQRDLRADNFRVIGRIAEAFDWSKFSTVHVAPIEGGLFAIIDGQHRTHAAAACGFDTVPCQVTHMTLQQQASAFAAINGLATKVTPLQIFRAALAASDAWAVEIRDVCEGAGCKALTSNSSAAEKKAGEVYAISYLRKLIDQRGSDVVTRALGILRQSPGVGDEVLFYTYSLFRPVMEALASRPHALSAPAAAQGLLEMFDFDAAQTEADRFVGERRRAGLPTMSKAEVLESLIGTALDKGLATSMREAA